MNQFSNVFTARRCASAIYAVVVCLPVCLSVCLCVCLSRQVLYQKRLDVRSRGSPYSSPTPYFAILALAGIPSLQARRLDLSKRFFRKIYQPTSCLHHLLPLTRDPAVTSRLRKSTLYPRPILRTKRYCSTINYALLNFQ